MPRPTVDVHATLLDDITSWRLPPGSPLREEEVGARLGVSRTPVREALARLRADGLVDHRPGQVAVVAPVGVDSTVAIFQARDALESYTVQLAATSPRRADFAPLARDYTTFARTRAGDRTAEYLFALSAEFDRALDLAVPNPHLLVPLRATRNAVLRLRRTAAWDTGRVTVAARQRAAVCRAIADGDADAAGRLNHERLTDSMQHALSALLAHPLAGVVAPLGD